MYNININSYQKHIYHLPQTSILKRFFYKKTCFYSYFYFLMTPELCDELQWINLCNPVLNQEELFKNSQYV